MKMCIKFMIQIIARKREIKEDIMFKFLDFSIIFSH